MRENATLGKQVRLLRFGDVRRTRECFHGGYIMKTKKKIALATLAAAMLATASLGIFAYAQDVAPQYAVIPCYKDECNGYARVPDPVMTNAGTGVHGTSSYLGRRCSYQWEEYTWYYTCTEGHNWSDVRRYEKNHSCSQSDGFVN